MKVKNICNWEVILYLAGSKEVDMHNNLIFSANLKTLFAASASCGL